MDIILIIFIHVSEWTDWYDDVHCDATKNADDSFAPKNSPADKNKMPTTFDEAENHGTSSFLLLHKKRLSVKIAVSLLLFEGNWTIFST